METNLPELCRRVWAKVPESQPSQVGFGIDNFIVAYTCIDRNHAAVWHNVGAMDSNMPAIKSLIQAAALRWLLANVNNMLKMDTLPNMGHAVWVMKKKRYWEDEQEAWIAKNKDITTCLLLAVERCQEYKAAEDARGEK
jgi:hypothetical protein